MRASQDDIRRIVTQQGVLVRRDHPELAGSVAWARRQGHLRSVLPGIYAPPESAGDRLVRIQALTRFEPDAVLTGVTAAQLSFWPGLRGEVVECASTRQLRPRPGFVFRRRVIPADLIDERGAIRLTAPALTALDLCEAVGGDGIDHVLRGRAATLSQLRQAFDLTRGRRGNLLRGQLLLDSRDEPWSAAERRAHRLLRDAGIVGWVANHPVRLAGKRYYLDIAFPGLLLVVEIDGRLHEDDSDVFENDRLRQNQLVLAGWTVLRFTWRMLMTEPEAVIAAVRDAIQQRVRA